MAEPFADASDVAARWRPLSTDEEALADTLAVDASALIRAQYPGIDAGVAAGSPDADVMRAVVSGMVRRAMMGLSAGDGVTQASETVGPFSHSVSYANPMGNLFITKADEVLIRGYRSRARSVALGF